MGSASETSTAKGDGQLAVVSSAVQLGLECKPSSLCENGMKDLKAFIQQHLFSTMQYE